MQYSQERRRASWNHTNWKCIKHKSIWTTWGEKNFNPCPKKWISGINITQFWHTTKQCRKMKYKHFQWKYDKFQWIYDNTVKLSSASVSIVQSVTYLEALSDTQSNYSPDCMCHQIVQETEIYTSSMNIRQHCVKLSSASTSYNCSKCDIFGSILRYTIQRYSPDSMCEHVFRWKFGDDLHIQRISFVYHLECTQWNASDPVWPPRDMWNVFPGTDNCCMSQWDVQLSGLWTCDEIVCRRLEHWGYVCIVNKHWQPFCLTDGRQLSSNISSFAPLLHIPVPAGVQCQHRPSQNYSGRQHLAHSGHGHHHLSSLSLQCKKWRATEHNSCHENLLQVMALCASIQNVLSVWFSAWCLLVNQHGFGELFLWHKLLVDINPHKEQHLCNSCQLRDDDSCFGFLPSKVAYKHHAAELWWS